MSCTQRNSYEDRIELGCNVRPKSSLILIWSFQDPIHPQLILEAPDDISCFQFNPVDPSIIVGGCVNGQLVAWDISAYSEVLKSIRSTEDGKEKKFQTPTMKYEIVSSIESSHRGIVQDIHWLPKHFEALQILMIAWTHRRTSRKLRKWVQTTSDCITRRHDSILGFKI